MVAAAKSLQLCPTLCDPIDGSPPGSASPGILQARTLEWVAISFSNVWKVKSESEVAQSCLTLSNPMDRSPPGSPSLGFSSRSTGVGAIAFPVQAVQLGHKQTKRPSSALSPDAQALKTSIFCRGAALAASSFATCFEPCHHHQLFCSLFSKSVLANFIRISIWSVNYWETSFHSSK